MNNTVDTQTHRILDFLEHVWPYISGVVITMLAALKLGWHSHKETRKQIQDNAAAIIAIHENMVTKADLHICREDVRQTDEDNLDKLYTRIEEHQKVNAQQHNDIMQQIISLHGGR